MKLGAVYVTETRIGAFAYTWNDPDAPPLFFRIDGNWVRSITYAKVYPTHSEAFQCHLGASYSGQSSCPIVLAFGNTLRDYASTFVDSFNNRLRVEDAHETHEARRTLEL